MLLAASAPLGDESESLSGAGNTMFNTKHSNRISHNSHLLKLGYGDAALPLSASQHGGSKQILEDKSDNPAVLGSFKNTKKSSAPSGPLLRRSGRHPSS